ncbi:hypothetical protein NIES2101_09835 [Calothrix sp. HK-06]|nr:hypothetical protein NIES2101_09835 [Calothrix sp. HK-06]
MEPQKNNAKESLLRGLLAKKAKISLICVFIMSFAGILVSNSLMENQSAGGTFPRNEFQLLQPAPTQPLGSYDYFGKLLNRPD